MSESIHEEERTPTISTGTVCYYDEELITLFSGRVSVILCLLKSGFAKKSPTVHIRPFHQISRIEQKNLICRLHFFLSLQSHFLSLLIKSLMLTLSTFPKCVISVGYSIHSCVPFSEPNDGPTLVPATSPDGNTTVLSS